MGYWFLRMNHYSLKQQPLHGHTTRVLHDGQDQRAARTFRDLENDRRAHDDRVRGDPVVRREPVPHSGAIHWSTALPSRHGLPPPTSPS